MRAGQRVRPFAMGGIAHEIFTVQDWLAAFLTYRVVAVLRAPSLDLGLAMAQAVVAGGLRLLEVTWTSDRPAHLVAALQERYPDCWVGAGTIRTPAALREARGAGCRFAVSPICSQSLLDLAQTLGIPLIPGALTPTEIFTALEAGATVVKVFPVSCLGGAAYLRALQIPLDRPLLFACGGVGPEQVGDYLQAGAIAVGLGSELFRQPWLSQTDWPSLTRCTAELLQTLKR
jgi:2-dehydro-3-deoxyphosphogluconate aldolase / (4S)-4-hydroxy-2-oxoglutarate aldolase